VIDLVAAIFVAYNYQKLYLIYITLRRQPVHLLPIQTAVKFWNQKQPEN